MKKNLKSVLALALGVVASHAQAAMDATKLPLFFEAGRGQAGITAPFAAHGPNSEFLITATNAQFVLHKPSGGTAAASMQFIGASSAAQITGDAELPGKANYFLGNDPAQWQSGVPIFGRVQVNDLYPGVNVVYYGNGKQLEYDFDLAAGIDPKTIAIRFDGAERVSVNPRGELVISLNGGEIIQHRPVVYQNIGSTRHNITGGYKVLNGNRATFALGSYDHHLPLVIDPVLSYSTYFGGNSGDVIYAIALSKDGLNSIFVAGQTLSTTFANDFNAKVPPGYQTNFQGGGIWGDAFVAKFDNSGTNPIYFTYLGGSVDEVPFGLAVDAAGNAFVTGFTDSPNFPTTNALQSHISGQIIHGAGVYPTDAFVTELNPGGTNLIFSTYLGGTETDVGTAITVDGNDNAYVVGYTYSTNLPVQPGAYQSSLKCTNYTLYYNANAFLAKIAPPGTNLVYCSYFGGNNYDEATAITLGESNYIYVAGATASTNFPLVNPLVNGGLLPNNTLLNGSTQVLPFFDAFVAKFVPGFTNNYTNVVYSTYLGGSNFDMATGIAADQFGNAYVVGSTTSTNFPYTQTNISSCVQTNTSAFASVTNAFLTQIILSNNYPVIGHSVLFGGNGNDVANGVSMDAAGNLFVVGSASSTNFPVTTNNLTGFLHQTNSASSPTLTSDAFVAAFYTNATMIYSAYLGGSLDNRGNAIAVDSAGNAYIAGQTASVDFPTFNAVQTNLTGISYDGFLAKVLFTVPPPVLTETLSGTNLLLSWQPIDQETPDTFALQSTTNLSIASSWTIVTTNLPSTNNGTFIYTLPYTQPQTNPPVQFFRLQLF